MRPKHPTIRSREATNRREELQSAYLANRKCGGCRRRLIKHNGEWRTIAYSNMLEKYMIGDTGFCSGHYFHHNPS